ncbi:MAG TPA: hypothetical protein PKX59_08115 [Bacteroidia bacterium]|nr:hypothetical protein [Bacteroidia bacterium]
MKTLKPKYKITPSKLESFRYLIEEHYGTTEDFIAEIKGTKEWSRKMNFGSAFHAVIEFGPEKYYDFDSGKYIVKESDFPEAVVMEQEQIDVAVRFRNNHSRMVSECKHSFELDMGAFIAVFSLKVDSLEGDIVNENKTTDKAVSFEKYYKSIQWKCYILATGVQKVVYNVFKYKGNEKKGYEVDEPVDFTFFPYENLKNDVYSLCREYIDFCTRHDLLDYVTVKPKANVEKCSTAS